MRDKSVTLEKITFDERKSYVIGTVEFSMLRGDGPTRNHISCEVRVEAQKEQSLSEIQACILREAATALSDAAALLEQVTPENLGEFYPIG